MSSGGTWTAGGTTDAAGTSSSNVVAGRAGAPNGGEASTAGTAGDGASDLGGAGGEGGAPDSPRCDAVSLITAVRATPTVSLIVEGSAVMFEGGSKGWALIEDTLVGSDASIVPKYQTRIRFGFSVYSGRSRLSLTEEDVGCASITSVGHALGNSAAIDALSSGLDEAYDSDGQWHAPTGHALGRLSTQLSASNLPDPKYVILMLASDPNTCAFPASQCGQDQAIFAAQSAYAKGIRTLVVGTGDIARVCDDPTRRCGLNHLKDMANAGVGLPVQAPPAASLSMPCSTAGSPKAKYADTTTTPGAATYSVDTGADALRASLSNIIENVVDCSFDLNVFVQSEPASGQVFLGSTELESGGLNGYRLEANRRQITLTGTACSSAKAGQPLRVAFPCVTLSP